MSYISKEEDRFLLMVNKIITVGLILWGFLIVMALLSEDEIHKELGLILLSLIIFGCGWLISHIIKIKKKERKKK